MSHLKPGKRSAYPALVRMASLIAGLLTLFVVPPSFGVDYQQVVVPVVSSIVGVDGVQWKCRVLIRNDFNYPMEIFVSLPVVDGAFLIQTLDPGQAIQSNDVVSDLFGLREVISPLLVQETSGRRPPTVIATTYGVYRGAFTDAQYTPAVFGRGMHAVGLLSGLTSNATYRTNLGMVNLGDRPATFTAALQLLHGRNVAVATLTIPAQGAMQTAVLNLFPLINQGENFSVVVDSPSPDAYTYAVVIANRTNDSRYVGPGPVLIPSGF